MCKFVYAYGKVLSFLRQGRWLSPVFTCYAAGSASA